MDNLADKSRKDAEQRSSQSILEEGTDGSSANRIDPLKSQSVVFQMDAVEIKRSNAANPLGFKAMTDGRLCKGRAFSIKERQLLGIHGLLPPSILTMEQQVHVVMQNFYRWSNDLDRYIYMMGLQDRNEKLFYRTIMDNLEVMMPIIYTPTVGLACQKYGLIFRKPRGLFITIHDAGHVYDILCNWPEKDVRAIVVTDGERILGLGDLGAYGMGIPVGKLSLYTACAGVKPHQCLPITLDVGTNRQSLREDPLYIGLRQTREATKPYDAFIDEFMKAVVKRYGQDTLIQFEDFGNNNAFRLLEKYRNRYCTFNDDIQGTAAVTVGGLLAALKITKGKLCEKKFVFQGAGEAAIGIASLLVMAMEKEGATRQQALDNVWMVDSRGLIVQDRPKGGLTSHKQVFAKKHAPVDTLEEVVKIVKPNGIIGVAAIAAAFTEEILKDMASFHENPIIFALSNPTSKAECTAEQAYAATEGRAIFASGSPFDPVDLNGKRYYPGQGNNAYIFPGIGLGVMSCRMRHIPDSVFLKSAQVLAECVTAENLAEFRVFPPLEKITDVSFQIAVAVIELAYQEKLAALYPEPCNKEDFVRAQMYTTEYESFLPEFYDWPEGAASQEKSNL